ncbi:MAG: hypothetical protein IKQ43_11180 [Treponema sp.]|nr:hypothetical protein [Treponema sp.]
MKRKFITTIAALLFIITGCQNVAQPTQPTNDNEVVSRPITYETCVINNTKYIINRDIRPGQIGYIRAVNDESVAIVCYSERNDELPPQRDQLAINGMPLGFIKPKETKTFEIYYKRVWTGTGYENQLDWTLTPRK